MSSLQDSENSRYGNFSTDVSNICLKSFLRHFSAAKPRCYRKYSCCTCSSSHYLIKIKTEDVFFIRAASRRVPPWRWRSRWGCAGGARRWASPRASPSSSSSWGHRAARGSPRDTACGRTDPAGGSPPGWSSLEVREKRGSWRDSGVIFFFSSLNSKFIVFDVLFSDLSDAFTQSDVCTDAIIQEQVVGLQDPYRARFGLEPTPFWQGPKHWNIPG